MPAFDSCPTGIRTNNSIVQGRVVVRPQRYFAGVRSFDIAVRRFSLLSRVIIVFLLEASVTRSGNKNLTNVSESKPKSSQNSFYLNCDDVFTNIPKSYQIFGLLL